MTRAFDLTISFAFAIETDRGSRFTLASKLTVLPKRRRFWQQLKRTLANIGQVVAGTLLPAPLFAG